ncbi:MAG: DUF2891 domain-containing protein [Steroidobacteraceae bacterium]|nr:DUF2891 domain-containing protein [Steroidobacteraceae bacterium]MBP7014961.1 DUF2891 domain-containing protein [Steroidobacteraceae bacterium]
MGSQRALLARLARALRPLGLIGLLAAPGVSVAVPALDEAAAGRFANLALHCAHMEYPNKISHTLASDADVLPPRELAPAFFGCYDWHSSVHGHWLLARLARQFPQAPLATHARAALAQSLTPAHVAGEVAYFQTPGRASYERPYGLAWLLLLAAELRAWDDPQARQWSQALAPLEVEAARRLRSWLPKLRYPIRVGEHSQTAFAFGLVHDWARVTRDGEMQSLIEAKARAFYASDTSCPLAYEPSGEDFLSPCLAEADLMRRILPAREYGEWLRHFLPVIPASSKKPWLAPAEVTDRSDPKLAHLDGLNLSRSWMLLGMASGLPPGDRRIGALNAAAEAHAAAALPAVTGEHYEGGHWLGTFAVYLTTRAGLRAP